jgi:hypothetical protein
MDNVDMYVLHLVRDPRAVSFSRQRPKKNPDFVGQDAKPRRHPVIGSSIRWLAANAAAEAMSLKLAPIRSGRRIRYEDLVTAPTDCLDRIQRFLEVPPVSIVDRENVIEFSMNHTAGGNLNRFDTGSIALKLDDEWRKRMSMRGKAMCTAITYPLLKKYGYLEDNVHGF